MVTYKTYGLMGCDYIWFCRQLTNVLEKCAVIIFIVEQYEEMLIPFYQTTWHIQEDYKLRAHLLTNVINIGELTNVWHTCTHIERTQTQFIHQIGNS